MALPRRQLVQLALFTPLALPGRPARADEDLRALLVERLRHEGIGLAAARLLPERRLQLAAAAKPGAESPDPARHRFEIGSITKAFVGVLLADAVGRGEVKLQGAVEEQIGSPLRDSAGNPLRYVDLATHRSGLPRLPPNLKPARDTDPYADYGDRELLASLRDFKASRRRDERFEYSNYAFGLLAWLLARRTGQPTAALLQARVLAPLGLVPGEEQPRAQGHDEQGQPVPAWQFSEATFGAGGLRLSAAQLARFAQAALGHFEHPLRQAFALALQPHSALGPAAGVHMGLGCMLMERAGQHVANHDGGTAGFSTSLWLNLTDSRGGLVLANAALPVRDLALHLMDERSPLRDVAAEKRAATEAALSLEPEQLAPLAGVYAATPQFKLTVRTRDGRLYAQATGQSEFELFARGPREFFARVTPLTIRFERGEPASALQLEQAGREVRFTRE